jgi:aminoglycoside N3'-acetyltransferase
MKFKELQEAVNVLLPEDDVPVVVYSAIWPFLRLIDDEQPKALPQRLLDLLISMTQPHRDLLMPTFGAGYDAEGSFDLENSPSSTGVLTELFRGLSGSKRSMSAYFSFNVLGPTQNEWITLKPKYAWGDGSLYDWMEQRNVHFLMLGNHPTNCSYLHRIEWLCREQVPYRFNKCFKGRLISGHDHISMEENLFVRRYDPTVINDFTVLEPHLTTNGMTVLDLEGVKISHMRCLDMRDTFMNLFKEDPFVTVQNRDDFLG